MVMNYRKFGNTDLSVSEIGFGAWAIGGGAMIGNTPIGWGTVDDKISEQAIYKAIDAGINFFDTADIYGLGHSEKIIGNAIGKNNDVIIATKVGNVSRNEQFTVDYTKEYILTACELSLKRLKRDVIDYYQLHTARLQHLQNGECIEAMQQLQQQGKIRYWGLSLNTFEPLEDAAFLMDNNYGNGFQLVLNLINKNALPVLQKASQKGYGIIARMALQFGLLTGKFDTDFLFEENDHRKNRITAAIVSETNETLKSIWILCSKYNCTKTQLALSYVLSYPGVSTVIPGIRTPEQVDLNTTGLFVLSSEDKMLIEQTDTSALLQLIIKQG
jgi:aryl-alcohol dehydrogenase-like predicted oxidoreductase